MKKRSLALFLAILLAFGSVLPILAVEPDVELDAGEGEETTLTYEELYVPGAVFAWNAFDKTEEEAITFGDDATEVVIAESGDMQLVLTKTAKVSALYKDGYLEVSEDTVAATGAQLILRNVYTKNPENVGDTTAYTSAATMALLDFKGTTVTSGFDIADSLAFAQKGQGNMWLSYGMIENVGYITAENIALHDAWSQAYLAAKKDATLQESFRTPIAKVHYDALVAMDEYKDHVFTVEVGAEGVAAYSTSGYEADWTAFAYLMAGKVMTGSKNDIASSRFYGIDQNSVNTPGLFKNGVAKTVFSTPSWAKDFDWKTAAGTVWTANGAGEVVTMTRVNSVKKTATTDTPYEYTANVYVDLANPLANVVMTNKNLPGTAAGNGADMKFASGLDARFYSIRVYDKALDVVEIATNHFAELCEFYQVDLTKLANMSEDARGIAINACTELVIGETDKAAIETIVDEAILAGGEGEEAVDPYAALYVTDGLMYRWDAYTGVSVFAGEATLADKNGGEVALKINNTSYDADKKYLIANRNPIDFSALIERDDDGAYVEDEIEFELVMTQTSWNETENGDNRPYMAFGPLDNTGSGKTHTEDKKGDPKSFGGYPCFYYAYRNPAASETETVTYYFDAEGNRVDAAVEGGESVNITYVTKFGGNIQITSENWGSARYFGNPVGESYSVGANMKFNVAADGVGTMDLALIRDRQITMKDNGGAALKYVISYVPGATSKTGAGTKIVPANLEEAKAMAAGNMILNSTYAADAGVFKIGGAKSTNLSVAYYAFRLYNRTLTDMERAQNHFADLCAYHQVDLTEFNKLSAENKQELYLAYNAAVIDNRDTATNTSFEDVTKEEIEAAIHELADETMKLYKALYVEGATTAWNAFQKKEGAATSDAVLTITGGEAAYSNGYLRLVGSKLTIANAYVAPADGKTLNYTTEFIYAGYDSGRTWTGENVAFAKQDAPAFATLDAYTTFQTIGVRENARFVDTESKAWHQAWAGAYAAAEKDEALKAAFWTPVSADDYAALKSAGKNVRDVADDGKEADPVGAYSQTGYETDWEGFQYVISSTGLNKLRFYQGIDYVSKGYQGVYNLNIMKNDWNGVPGGWMAQQDYVGSFGSEMGNWSTNDFGVATAHAWVETLAIDPTKVDKDGNPTPNTVALSVYSDGRQVGGKTYEAAGTGAFSTSFSMQNFDADIYAIRIYPFALTTEQLAQNHFADLANYTLFENIDVFTALKDTSKAALYTEFASARLSDDKAELKAALENAVAKAAVLEKLEGVTAESVLAFDGYQATIWANPAFRAVFSAKDFNVAGATVKASIGVKVGEGEIAYTEVDLTADKTIIEIKPEMTKAAVETEYAFTASVTVECDGFEFTYDCDMSSAAFGETISVAELYSHAALKDGACAKLVAAAE